VIDYNNARWKPETKSFGVCQDTFSEGASLA